MARRFVTLLVGIALVVGACGGGGLSAEEQVMANELESGVMFMWSEVPPQWERSMGQSNAECIADGLVRMLGVDRLREIGFGAGRFATGEEAYGSLYPITEMLGTEGIVAYSELSVECMDPGAMLAESWVAIGVSRDGAECMATELMNDDGFRESFEKALVDAAMGDQGGAPGLDGDEFAVMGNLAMAKCLSDDDIDRLMELADSRS